MAGIEYREHEYYPYYNSEASTKRYFNAVFDSMDSVNPSILTRTADTGQMVPNSLSFPLSTAVNAVHGYGIWKFQDSIGSIYIKIDFRNSSAVPGNRLIQTNIEIGRGTNGSGTITNSIFSTSMSVDVTETLISNATDKSGSHFFIADEGMFAILIFGLNRLASSSYDGHLFYFSRPQTTAGVTKTDVLMICHSHQGSTYNSGLYMYNPNTSASIQIATNTTYANTVLVPNQTSQSYSSVLNTDMGRMFHMPTTMNRNRITRDGSVRIRRLTFFVNGEILVDNNSLVSAYDDTKNIFTYNSHQYISQSFFTGASPHKTCLYLRWS